MEKEEFRKNMRLRKKKEVRDDCSVHNNIHGKVNDLVALFSNELSFYAQSIL